LSGKLVAGSAVAMIKRNSSDEVAIDEDGYGAKIGFGGRYNFAGGGNFTVGVGNVVIGTAGKGIDFSANTHAAGMTSELLTWYEEGVWTPVVVPSSGSITTQTCSGRYTRIGRLVTIQLSIVINDVGTAGSIASISGLPFTSSNTNDVGSGSLREYNSTGLEWNFTVNPNATTIFAAQYNNSTAISTSYGWRGSLSYFV